MFLHSMTRSAGIGRPPLRLNPPSGPKIAMPSIVASLMMYFGRMMLWPNRQAAMANSIGMNGRPSLFVGL